MLTFLWCYGQDGIINMRTSIAEYLSYVSSQVIWVPWVSLLPCFEVYLKLFPNACL